MPGRTAACVPYIILRYIKLRRFAIRGDVLPSAGAHRISLPGAIPILRTPMIRAVLVTAAALFVLPTKALPQNRTVTVSVTAAEEAGRADAAAATRRRAVSEIVTRLKKNQALGIVSKTD